jgi:hypothetical protein
MRAGVPSSGCSLIASCLVTLAGCVMELDGSVQASRESSRYGGGEDVARSTGPADCCVFHSLQLNIFPSSVDKLGAGLSTVGKGRCWS